MNESKKTNLIVILLAAAVVLLLYQNVSYGRRLNDLSSQVGSLRGEMTNQAMMLYSNLAGQLETSLKQARSLVESVDVAYAGVDAVAKTVSIRLRFRLRENAPDARVRVFAAPVNAAAAPGEGFEAVTANGVDYACEFALPYSDDYNLDIYRTDGAGGTVKMNADPVAANIRSEMQQRTSLPASGTAIGTEGVDVSFELENRTFGQPDFMVRKVEVILLAGGREAARKDVTNASLANAKEIDRFNLMVAAGEAMSGENLAPSPERGPMQTDAEGVERGYFFESFPYDKLPLELRTGNAGSEYTFSVEVTFANGAVLQVR